jgi:hypothetical protein
VRAAAEEADEATVRSVRAAPSATTFATVSVSVWISVISPAI